MKRFRSLAVSGTRSNQLALFFESGAYSLIVSVVMYFGIQFV
jgi:hypothetical protein